MNNENKKTITLVATDRPDKRFPCDGCFFDDVSFACANYSGETGFPCTKNHRKDHRDIIWKEV